VFFERQVPKQPSWGISSGAAGYPFFGTARMGNDGLSSMEAASASSNSSSLPSNGQGADASCRPGLQHSPWQ
jgi:hypothetical protein